MDEPITSQPEQPFLDVAAAGQLVASGDAEQVTSYVKSLPPGECARLMAQLAAEEQNQLLSILPSHVAAGLIEEIPNAQAVQLVGQLPADEAAAIVDRLHSDEQADILGRLPHAEAEAILDQMDPRESLHARRLREYPDDTAGGLMITEYLAFPDDLTVDDVLADLRENAATYAGYDVQYAYVFGNKRMLAGVLRLRDLLLSPRQTPVRSIMLSGPLHVNVATDLKELQRFFDRHHFFGVPVTDDRGVLMGVVRRDDVIAAAEEAANKVFLKFAGILGGEELRSLPLLARCTGRLSWLSINIVLNVVAASVIALHQETLAAVIALAVFLPIISDMSGCAGSQAVAVTMRELGLSLVRPADLFRVARKELALGLLNGLTLGLVLGLVGLLWKGNVALGLVVGGAMAINTVVAVCIGGTIPLLLYKLKFDPALASAPILTTLTDTCGFFLVLTFARMLLPYLA